MGKRQNYYEPVDFFDKVIDNYAVGPAPVSPDLGEKPCGIAIAPFGFLSHKQSFDLGRAKGFDEFKKLHLQQQSIANPSSRSDKGKPHKKPSNTWRKQAEVADDFSKSAKEISGKWYGKMTLEKVKDWETRYPDETKHEKKSGYYAKMRTDPDLKKEYWDAAGNWNEYWRQHNIAFKKWLRQHPKSDHEHFRKNWLPPGKTVHMSDTDKTTRYGMDTSLMNRLDNGGFDK